MGLFLAISSPWDTEIRTLKVLSANNRIRICELSMCWCSIRLQLIIRDRRVITIPGFLYKKNPFRINNKTTLSLGF